MIVTNLVALAWVLAYALAGWPGVVLVAAAGLLWEAVLRRLVAHQARRDRAKVYERWEQLDVDEDRAA